MIFRRYSIGGTRLGGYTLAYSRAVREPYVPTCDHCDHHRTRMTCPRELVTLPDAVETYMTSFVLLRCNANTVTGDQRYGMQANTGY